MMVKKEPELMRRQMYLPSPTSEVHYRRGDDSCCGVSYLKHVLYVFNCIFLVSVIFVEVLNCQMYECLMY